MVQVIIATHGNFAKGLKQSVEFIMGKQPNLFALPIFTESCPSVEAGLQSLPTTEGECRVFLTDLRGGSVNTTILADAGRQPHTFVVCGVNLPLIIQLLVGLNGGDEGGAIREAIDAGRQGVELCSLDDESEESFDSF